MRSSTKSENWLQLLNVGHSALNSAPLHAVLRNSKEYTCRASSMESSSLAGSSK